MAPKFAKIPAYKELKEHWRVHNDKAQARREVNDIYKYGPGLLSIFNINMRAY
jgi:hypothetical protein